MRIPVEVEEIEMQGDYGTVPSVQVTCSECGESVQVYGRGDASIRRGCIMLKEMCGQKNYYVYDENE
jgi:hypothetical protein